MYPDLGWPMTKFTTASKALPLIIFMATKSLAVPCPQSEQSRDEYGYTTYYQCKEAELKESREYHPRTKKLVSHKIYNKFGPTLEKSWSAEGRFTYLAKSEYFTENHFVKTVLDTETQKLKSKEEIIIKNGEEFRIKEWVIHQSSFTPRAIKHFKIDDYYPYKIDQLNKSGKVIKTFQIQLKAGYEFAGHVESFTSFDPQGNKLGNYHESRDLDIRGLLTKRGELQFFESQRSPVVIIDTGFDISHPSITKYLYNSPVDIPFDGIDNDGNGRVDDSFGWHIQEDYGLDLDRDDNNIRETHFLTHTPYPVSHGTHVAAKALEKTKNFGLVGFAGDVAIARHLLGANQYIQKNKVKFANMSFAIGFPGAPLSAPNESFFALEKLLKDNPETLFTVAAGNGRSALDLDLAGNQNFPASYSFENMLIVGALNTSDYKAQKDWNKLKEASFSKRGKQTVDIFAPGQMVVSAHSGGGSLALNGTSMASPFALNIILRASEINPKLTPMQLKQIVMKTAFIPKKRLECLSGGMIHPERVYLAAKLSQKKSLEEAIREANKI